MKSEESSKIHDKRAKLEQILLQAQSVVVAYSAGVDSTFLLKAAHDVLGDNAHAIIAKSSVVPARDISEAEAFCKEHGIDLKVLEYDPFSVEGFAKNPKDRCYICKKALFSMLLEQTHKFGANMLADGSNVDDMSDYRPGMKALEELGIRSPLKEAGLTKNDIRQLSSEDGLPTWDKPSFACLATRIPCEEPITPDKLSRIEKAEDMLLKLGIRQFRVRAHGDLARIEVLPADIVKIASEDMRDKITSYFNSIGYKYVSLDLAGYRTGSMNKL